MLAVCFGRMHRVEVQHPGPGLGPGVETHMRGGCRGGAGCEGGFRGGKSLSRPEPLVCGGRSEGGAANPCPLPLSACHPPPPLCAGRTVSAGCPGDLRTPA